MKLYALPKAALLLVCLLCGGSLRAQVPDTVMSSAPVYPLHPNPDSIRVEKAKRDSLVRIIREKKGSVYVELGGNGGWGSLNLERYFPAKDRNTWVARAGVGYFVRQDTSYFLVPLTFGKVYRQKKYLLEVAIGLAPYYSSPARKYPVPFVTGVLGYRRSFAQGKAFFKAAFTPYVDSYISFKENKVEKKRILQFDYKIIPNLGIGIGRYF
jgi:hypothetical protein